LQSFQTGQIVAGEATQGTVYQLNNSRECRSQDDKGRKHHQSLVDPWSGYIELSRRRPKPAPDKTFDADYLRLSSARAAVIGSATVSMAWIVSSMQSDAQPRPRSPVR